jgi:hypothetical protein
MVPAIFACKLPSFVEICLRSSLVFCGLFDALLHADIMTLFRSQIDKIEGTFKNARKFPQQMAGPDMKESCVAIFKFTGYV